MSHLCVNLPQKTQNTPILCKKATISDAFIQSDLKLKNYQSPMFLTNPWQIVGVFPKTFLKAVIFFPLLSADGSGAEMTPVSIKGIEYVCTKSAHLISPLDAD